ncbi:MAG TPA: hypothetical protein VND95_05550 [Stellaceae bacterium]|nr:hypothetical protein [Stellaceae bacterium]
MAITDEFVQHLTEHGYHPRSSRHSDFLSLLIIRDLIDRCRTIRIRAARGEIVAKLHHHQMVGTDDWQIDIAIGTCAGNPVPPTSLAEFVGLANTSDLALPPIMFAPPVIIQIAIELKGVMTEHGKARRNRLRDFGAFLGHAQRYDPKTVVAAFLAVNSADCFYSPLNLGKTTRSETTRHGGQGRTGRQVAKAVVDLYRSIYLRHSPQDRPGLDGIGVIAVEHDNIASHPDPSKYALMRRPTIAAPAPPAPVAGDPLHYEAMLQRVCNAYTARFAGLSGQTTT